MSRRAVPGLLPLRKSRRTLVHQGGQKMEEGADREEREEENDDDDDHQKMCAGQHV